MARTEGWNRSALMLVPALVMLLCRGAVGQAVDAPDPSMGGRSWALLVGINTYKSPDIPALSWCEADVDATASALQTSQGFRPDDISMLKGPEATRQGIIEALSRFTDPRLVGENDRVVVYFSGHGQTVPIPRNGMMGFLLPYDAAVDLHDITNPSLYYSSCIPMSELRRISDLIPGKHVLYLVDACYSGLAIESTRAVPMVAGAEALGAVPSRHIITAGMKGEQALEDSALGHGVMTAVLLEALTGPACDFNKDGYVTAQELGTYVQGEVPRLARQTPQFASFGGEGQFLLSPGGGAPARARGPVIELLEPAVLRSGDLRLTIDPTGGAVRFAGLVFADAALQALTVDGRPVTARAASPAELQQSGHTAAGALAFSAQVELGMGEERVIVFAAQDVQGAEGTLRVQVVAQAQDNEAPEVRITSLASAPGPDAASVQRGRYLTLAPAARALPAANAPPPEELSASVRNGECLRIQGLARDALGAVSVTLDGEPVDVQMGAPELVDQLGWDQGLSFDVLIDQPVGDHHLLVVDPAGNVTHILVHVDQAAAEAPQIIILEPATERGTGLALPKGVADVSVIGLVKCSSAIARVAVADRDAAFREATADELRQAGAKGPALRFEAQIPLPIDGSALSITVTVTAADGQVTTQTFMVRRRPDAIRLEFASDEPSYVIGERVHFTMKSDQEAWVYLYHLEPGGGLSLFLPNPVEPDNLLKAGIARTFPAMLQEAKYGTSYGLFAQEPIGTDTVYCLALQQPLSAASVASITKVEDLAAAVDASGETRGLRLELPKSPTPEALTQAAEKLSGALKTVRYDVKAR